jgi:hypothetical protein
MEEMRITYKTLTGKSERKKRPLGRARRRWEDSIRMDLREIGRKFVEWLYLVQVGDHWWALVNTIIKRRIILW